VAARHETVIFDTILEKFSAYPTTIQRRSEMTFRTKGSLGRVLPLLGFALVVTSSLSAQQVHYNFMPGTDFSKYHTYKWVEIPGGIHPNQIIDQEIRQAVNNTLAGKGLTLATGDTADVFVGYQCSVDQEKQLKV
jgi:Domain of unknown function (DUF4136)